MIPINPYKFSEKSPKNPKNLLRMPDGMGGGGPDSADMGYFQKKNSQGVFWLYSSLHTCA